MNLKVLGPTEVILNQAVTKVIAEAADGSFCILPRHVDFVAALVPGLLSFVSEEGAEEFLAVDEGTLVKRDAEVLVSTRDAVRGGALGELQRIVEQRYRVLDDREKAARSATAKLEADFVRRFLELGESFHA